ncbi:toxin-antitoxin system antitoxin subunit [Burkholderia latens]|uniref:Toxin-antitoxin system antitoxin subunit n=1 Tax=Burkholderia latens TaxID=488446 RepID=A0A6H9TK33_9BURK|nr:toxin-antitoxin system antitoxin subunit [Burkholderia latens]
MACKGRNFTAPAARAAHAAGNVGHPADARCRRTSESAQISNSYYVPAGRSICRPIVRPRAPF